MMLGLELRPNTAPEEAYLDTGHVLREALIFLAYLEGQLPCMAHDQYRYLEVGKKHILSQNPHLPTVYLL